MIVDMILDRQDGVEYNAKDFYDYVREEERIFEFDPTISFALDFGTNEEVQKALCEYIDKQEYNPEIKGYINSVAWV